MLHMNPDKRWSAEELLKDDWLSNLSKEMLTSILDSDEKKIIKAYPSSNDKVW